MGRIIVAFLTLVVAGMLGVGVLFAKRTVPQPAPQVVSVAPEPPPVVMRTVPILVAARPVHAGVLLQPDDMAATSMSQDHVPAGAMIDGTEARATLRGAMVRKSLEIGTPLTVEGVLRPGDRGFLAAVLDPGSRAVSVQVDSVSGTAGLIWPGDRIDLILTETIEDPTKSAGKRLVGERVLENLRVIAVDQQLVEGGQQSPLPSMASNRILTLEVGEAGAEKVAVATRLGKLSAVVRSAVEATTASHRPATVWADDVSPALKAGPGGPVRIYRATEQPTLAGK